MAKSGFKLRSGNISGGSSFKIMGATSPESGDSPMKLLGRIIRGGQQLYRYLRGSRKIKSGTYKGKYKHKKSKLQTVSEETKNMKFNYTKTGNFIIELINTICQL
jgi:hypothetical protein